MIQPQLSGANYAKLVICDQSIELLFRLWKTYTLIDESVSKNPWRILTEMYAKLIAVLIQHWLIIVFNLAHPREKHCPSLSYHSKIAVLLHLAMANESALCSSISTIITTLKSSPAVLLRKKQPATFQILSDPIFPYVDTHVMP